MTLFDVMEAYLLERVLQPDTITQVKYAILGIERFAGRELKACELTSELLNQYMLHVSKSSLRYAKHHRSWLMSLLRFAVEIGALQTLPNRVRRIKLPETVPTAWTEDQVAKLALAASKMPGCFREKPEILKGHSGIPKAKWYTPYVMARWDTALRLKDLLSIERGDIWPGGIVSIVQNKTGHAHSVILRPETIEHLQELWELMPEGRMMLPQLCVLRHIYAEFKKLAASVGLHGTGKKLRISAATAAEKAEAGAATRLLGHRTPDMARRHYIDPRLINRAPVAPPRLNLQF
jgi:integrase